MKPCKLIIKDEVNIKLVGLPVEIRRLLAKEFKYIVPHAKFSPAYRLGRWDGAVNFFGIGGDGYLYHLDRILEILTTNNFEISEIEDRRRPINIDFPKVTDDFWGDTCWPAGHPMAGQPIRIRPHQLEALQLFSENPQCIQSLPTSSGKCLTGDTLLTVKTSADSFPKTLPIIDLINHIERELGIRLFDNIEVELGSFKVSVDTPQGEKEITHVIKKENLDILKIVFDSGYELKAASSHILRSDDNDVFLSELRIGDYVDHKNGILTIVDIIPCESEDCYDIAVSNPHYFYDANGLIHHNTIITATMAKLCEPYGRTVTIVPSTSLVEQTGEDFRNCGLDVGLYYGTRKDLNKTHTICTWQSLSALRKKDKVIKEDGVSSTLTLTDFLNNVVGVIIDECFDGDSLVLCVDGYKPIRDIIPGDMIINYNEHTGLFKVDTVLKRFENLINSSSHSMFELTFDNGQIIKVTGNHKVLTHTGWKTVLELSEDDDIISFSEKDPSLLSKRYENFRERLNKNLQDHGQSVRVIYCSTLMMELSTGHIFTNRSYRRLVARLTKRMPEVWINSMDLLLSGEITEAQIKREGLRRGGISCQEKHPHIRQLLRTYDRKLIVKKPHEPWNKGLTKYTDERLLEISKKRTGDGNPNYGKINDEEYRKRHSLKMKEKILTGEFTPNSGNRRTHFAVKYNSRSYRSSWEAAFHAICPNFEYESLRIKYRYSGKDCIYIVDFYDPVSKVAVEVKPYELLDDPKTIAKLSALLDWCCINNAEMRIASQDFFKVNLTDNILLEFDETTQRKLRAIK